MLKPMTWMVTQGDRVLGVTGAVDPLDAVNRFHQKIDFTSPLRAVQAYPLCAPDAYVYSTDNIRLAYHGPRGGTYRRHDADCGCGARNE